MGVDKVPDNARLVRNMLDATPARLRLASCGSTSSTRSTTSTCPTCSTPRPPTRSSSPSRSRSRPSPTSGQVNPFSNHYWDHPGYKLPPEVNLQLTAHYLQSIEAQQWANQAGAVIAGKFPMIMTMAAGGITQLPDSQDINYYLDRMDLVKQFTEQVMWPDLLAVAGAFPELATFGQGVGNFLTWGLLDDKSQDPYERGSSRAAASSAASSRSRRSTPPRRDSTRKYSYYDDSHGQGQEAVRRRPEGRSSSTAYPPIDGAELPERQVRLDPRGPLPQPGGKDVPMEVGPLSEVLVAYLDGQPDVVKYVDQVLAAVGAAGKPEVLVSNLGRVAARVIKARVNMDHAPSGHAAAREHQGRRHRVLHEPERDADGEGICGYDAPRGALSHYCRIKGGKTTKYAAVPASNWNLAPRDDMGSRGPVEEALVGTPVVDPDQAAGDPADGPHLRSLNGLRGSRD